MQTNAKGDTKIMYVKKETRPSLRFTCVNLSSQTIAYPSTEDRYFPEFTDDVLTNHTANTAMQKKQHLLCSHVKVY